MRTRSASIMCLTHQKYVGRWGFARTAIVYLDQ